MMCEGKKRYPYSGTFELTGRCNLRCKMCLVRVDGDRIRELGTMEKTTREWIDMAEQVRDAGTLGLLLTGGEAMLRPDFCEIYEAVAQMGFILTLYTNATIVTDKILKILEQYPPHKIGVTMYGASNDTYGKLCGCEDGYDRFVDGIQRLSSLPSVFEMRTTIVKDNLGDLEAMKQFTKKELGQDMVLQISRFVTKSIRGGVAHAEECRLTPEENIELIYTNLMKLRSRRQTKNLPVPKEVIQSKRRTGKTGRYLFENCGAGINQYTITWDGRMYACELLTEGYTEPFKEGFCSAWGKLPEQYPRSREVKACERCKYVEFCELCPAIRRVESGSWFGVPEYFCGEAQCLYQILSELKIVEIN